MGAKELAEAWGRSPRGVDHVRVPAWDEDATTLALDAAQGALRAARLTGASLRAIVAAGPIEATLVASALDAPRARIVALDGALCGIDALATAFALGSPCLVVGARVPTSPPGTEARLEEGAGGVALLLAPDGPLKLAAHAAATREVPSADRAELSASGLAADAASRLALPTGAPAFVVGPSSGGAKPQRPAVDVRKDAGSLGAAEVLVALAETLREDLPKGQWCLAGDATSQRAVLLVLASEGRVAVAPADERVTHVNATRALLESRSLAPGEALPDSPMGAYVPPQTWVEDLPARLRLVAQRCVECQRVLYPPRGACPVCRGRAFEDLQLPDAAVVYAATRIGRGGAPSEFALEQAQVGAYWVGVVEWPEHRVRVTARLAGYDEHGPAIGEDVRAVVRRLFEQDGSVRYGVKFARV